MSHIIAKFWPQGDPDKLTQAAEDWQRAAKLISEVADYGQDETIKVTASSQGTAIDAFQNNWVHTQQAITTISSAATQISSACSVYATEIRQLRTKLEHLAEIAGGVAVGALALTIFTVGISDAAGGIAEGTIAAEAAAAAAGMTAELSASADLAEAASIVDQAAAEMIPVAATTAGSAVAAARPHSRPTRLRPERYRESDRSRLQFLLNSRTCRRLSKQSSGPGWRRCKPTGAPILPTGPHQHSVLRRMPSERIKSGSRGTRNINSIHTSPTGKIQM